MRTNQVSLLAASFLILAGASVYAGPTKRQIEASHFLPPVEARATPSVSLEGSNWEVEFPKEIFCHARFNFLANGQVNALIDDGDSRQGWDSYRGSWAQDGARVVVVVNGRSLYDGNVSGQNLEGKVSRVDGTGGTPFIARTGTVLANFKTETGVKAAQVRQRMAEDAAKTVSSMVANGQTAQQHEAAPQKSSAPKKVTCTACSGRGGKALGYKGLAFGANFKRCGVCDGTGLVWVGR